MLNPSTIFEGSKPPEELAKPNAKIEIKVGQSKEDLQKLEQDKKDKKVSKGDDPKDIWKAGEVTEQKNLPDDRPQP